MKKNTSFHAIDYAASLNHPGHFPFTRGVHPTMYRGRTWTMRQYAGFGSAQETNERFRHLIAHGGTGLSVAFDLPTQMGYDSDDTLAIGEVGKTGVAIDTIDDMRRLFQNIPLSDVSTSMTINATAPILLAMYMVVGEEQGVDPSLLSGTVQNDLLKEFAARGTYIYPPMASLRLTTDLIEYCTTHLPKWNPISISGYHMREAGCTAVQEVAFTIANGLTYVEAVLARGLEIDDFAKRLSFFFCCHNNFIEEIAKFRTARRLWARLLKERYNASDRSCMLRFHTQTGGSTLTSQQPVNNSVRVAIQAMAAVLGGTQSLHTNAFDEALALPTEKSATLALRTQQILAEETGVVNTVDPCGGAYEIEQMTDAIEEQAREYLKKIDEMGGMVAAIESEYIQQEIHKAAYEYQKALETGRQKVVGVNTHMSGDKGQIDLMKVDSQIESKQCECVKIFKANRNNEKTSLALSTLKSAALGSDNLMPLIISCVKNKCTLGEISNTLRGVFGTYD